LPKERRHEFLLTSAGIKNTSMHDALVDLLDDQTAIKLTDGTVEVVSEGHWKLFTPQYPRG